MNRNQQDDFQTQMNKMGDEIEKNVTEGMQRLSKELETASSKIQAAWKQTQMEMQQEKQKAPQEKAVFCGNKPRRFLKKAKSNKRWAWFWGLVCLGGILSLIDDILDKRILHDLPSTLCAIGLLLFASAWIGYKSYLYRKASEYFELMQGKEQIDIKTLATYTNTPEKTALTELEIIKKRNWIKPMFFSPDKQMVYANINAAKTMPLPSLEPQTTPAETACKNPEKQNYIAQIRQLNQTIENPRISEKVQKIEELAQSIFEKAKQTETPPANLKKFESYYLPTTIKLLNVYTEIDDEPIEGMNIEKIRQDIPELLDTLIEAYQNLLDSFYANVAMNVSSEISVLKDMLAQEGLVETEDTLQINE